MLLEGKRLLITGITTDDSIAFSAAKVAQEQGAEIVVTNFGRALRLTERAVQRLPSLPPVLEMDITNDDHVAAVMADLDARWGKLDGALHAIAFAPVDALGGNFLNTPQESAATAFVTSAFSLKTLAVGALPLMQKAGGGSVVGLDFDNTGAWPAYDWMGVAKSALQSVSRYLARDLGRYQVRVNLVSAGPLRTVAARSIPGFDHLHDTWSDRAPLRWDSTNPLAVAKMICVLLSDWAPLTTGEVIHVDGGFHAISAPGREEPQPTE
ncbi:MAG TPA: enoyl-ACP reductase FabI [Acidimicrobiia bacterium]|nr:enoyl-ACP reductase FabI [Acidimicrobiia bacterium]